MADILANSPSKGQITAIPVTPISVDPGQARDWRQTLKDVIETVEGLLTAVRPAVASHLAHAEQVRADVLARK